MIVEGVSYQISWRKFRRGTSIFIPCLDGTKAKEEVMVVLKRLRIEVALRVSIEDGIRGLRIWRV
ncbi:hypothetical protein UFOVP1295_15 [uncultured Caudovirales phage]|uniref:Uncharacterized protein n=1 Tax=uncultured Caudovirales phage TaxID=2100421 RepID=A0A6J5RMJ2_9CAUD|nr:hypothetical protein UFOVP1295_15 [uncultured Caudovirales phage]